MEKNKTEKTYKTTFFYGEDWFIKRELQKTRPKDEPAKPMGEPRRTQGCARDVFNNIQIQRTYMYV